ncbi:IclR family transcriptional regulator [Actinomycetospora termitidis]|uniref:IclR family transcriptional regulator C-terminal domain-containing protein n=1 Tax=Actinomycetospora termitidis TaxID=3053470 RepID=A0ABT7M807_9PSEU|nr:IclR family transcriptional regulator C-terminal domain-containing protein [Actinomycetospora sp. Odt1-22]MDL5156708.1 IclR family transcriptional regulator C-terminal domain-containing protein [Actinomycetospora sp. Odt1-22]
MDGLRRDADLLGALASPEAQGSGLGVARLATLTGRTESQVSRALVALADEGLVERDPRSRRYALGWRLYAFAARTTEARLVRTAGRVLTVLAARWGVGAHLCRLHGDAVATVLTVAGDGSAPRVAFDVSDVPVEVSSAGRVLLAFRDEAALARRLGAAGLDPGIAARTLADGVAVVDGELDRRLAGVSAPVRDIHGGVVAALNTSGPIARVRPVLDRLGAATVEAAADLSTRLGA